MDTVVTLKKGEGRALKAGGAWIYDNEIDKIEGTFKNGAIVSVVDFDGYPLGSGMINQNSKIRVRMLTRNANEIIDEEFLLKRVQNAWDYRKRVMLKDDLGCCRIIFGEADFLPGLVVDRYENILVCECLSLGMDNLKMTVLGLLLDVLSKDGIKIDYIYERSDAPVRKKEGLEPKKALLYANGVFSNKENFDKENSDRGTGDLNGIEIPQVKINENGVFYLVDVVNGQKTGFFLDQKYNRLAMQRICRDADRVLDCFTHMGTFALNAGLAGAKEVTGLDISEFAINQATENSKFNGLEDRVKFRCANVLDELPRLYEAGERFDVVILDPPAFTKSREATKNAIKGYREINMKGLKLVTNGGYFATCSCSHFMTQELLTEVVAQAAKAVHKRLRQIEFRTQAPDHPILWAADESYYLKFFIF